MPSKKFKLSKEQKKLADKLTALQRGTVINIIAGRMSNREAYLAAGAKCKTDKAMDASCSRMLATVKVKAFHDSLLESAAGAAVMTRVEALESLTEVARMPVDEIDKQSKGREGIKLKINSQLASIKQLSDLEGWNAPAKTEHSGPGGGPIQTEEMSENDLARRMAFVLSKGAGGG